MSSKEIYQKPKQQDSKCNQIEVRVLKCTCANICGYHKERNYRIKLTSKMKTFVSTATFCHPLDYILKNNAFHKTRHSKGKWGGREGHESTVNIPKRKTFPVPSLNKHILTLGSK
jgi:hypothetical protein